ncbi:MAG: 4a-hydroxytetrahydrobiopterin dehydratase [Verrucomicrobiaceae bacterium]|nr:4a-hydroxytetrahydrobiopterin dehydratase [Verrucomicrobiaceae bacterium]
MKRHAIRARPDANTAAAVDVATTKTQPSGRRSKTYLRQDAAMLSPTPLKPEAIAAALTTLPGWEQHGTAITKKWKFKTYLAGIDFVTQVAKASEALDHHPDLRVGWRKVEATLSTHVANGLTEYDIELARQIDKVFEGFAT